MYYNSKSWRVYMNTYISSTVSVFHGMALPVEAQPVGYAALIDAHALAAPFPYECSAIGLKHKVFRKDRWHIFTPRHTPEATLTGYITFALKYEGVDLLILKKLFEKIDAHEIENIIEQSPTGSYSRRIWFLYEWLTDSLLSLPDLDRGNYIEVIDSNLQVTVKGGRKSQRHRVINNLPGTPEFCPLVRRTELIESYLGMNIRGKALSAASEIPPNIISRAASFLLLKDSQASFAIENEADSFDRIERWGSVVREAGKNPLTVEELIRLQKIVIGDYRFIPMGVRTAGGFIGEYDRVYGMPVPQHISAKYENLNSLLNGLIAYDQRVEGNIDPVVAAAAVSFGFVLIHPFSDGNGRIHRYLIHHILVQSGFNPPGLIFPVSATMLRLISDYEKVLQSYSSGVLPFIRWKTTPDQNVSVENETIDYYRYFDATPFAEFLFRCVLETIEHDIPEEGDFLVSYDSFRMRVQSKVDMPDRTLNLLYRMLRRNKGRFSKRMKEREFRLLSPEEVDGIEQAYEISFIHLES